MTVSYGRLEIYWPEGPVESFLLLKPIVAIGRSTGNDLVVDRNGISRYHATLGAVDGGAALTDLEAINGVYVDGERISANEPLFLRGGEEIQLADVRMVYHAPEISQDTVPNRPAETSQRVITDFIAVQFYEPEISIIPGSHAHAALSLENTSTETHRYTIRIEGVPSEWVRLERSEIELDPREEVKILVNVKPLRRSESRPGAYPVTAVIAIKNDPDSVARVDSTFQIGSFSGFGVVMGTSLIEGNAPFRFHVHNQGNDTLNMRFRGLDPNNVLHFKLDTPRIALAGGERHSITGTIRPKNRRLFGSERRYRYDIIALSEDASHFQAPVSGLYVAKPLLPAWIATLAIPLVAFVVIGLVILGSTLLGGKEAIPPQITLFSVDQEAVEQGQPVSLRWSAENAESVRLLYARAGHPPQETRLEDVTVQNTQLLLDGSGVYTITLLVESVGGSQSGMAVVRVLPAIQSFHAEPPTLLRNITQNLTLNWSVSGPDTVISLESDLLSQSGTLPNQGAESYTIHPADAVTITLRALGQDGTENSQVLQLALEDPRCILSNPQAIIQEGPGRHYDSLATITELGYTVNPTGRSIDGTWLQIRHEDALAWVRVADFTCQGFTPAQLDTITQGIPPSPTPLPTATPIPTQTPTLTPTTEPTARPTRTLSATSTPSPTSRR